MPPITFTGTSFLGMELTGVDQLAATLRRLPSGLGRKVQLRALREGAEPMRVEMGILAPRGPTLRRGRKIHLADSMTINAVRQSQLPGDEAAVAVGPSKDAFWGLFQEYGTVHHAAQPFARRAFDAKRQAALERMVPALWAGLRAKLPSSFGPRATSGGRFL